MEKLTQNSNATYDEYVYKEVDSHKLKIRVFGGSQTDSYQKPSVIFFFGGGWSTGSIEQFRPFCECMAEAGIVAFTPEYRIRTVHQTTPMDSVNDAKDALDWIYGHAQELGVDPSCIALSGGSAGGHLALCAAIQRVGKAVNAIPTLDVPKGLVLFNPVCDTSENGFGSERFGENALEFSPLHQMVKGMPATLILHGTADRTVPFQHASDFCEKMKELGNDCELVAYSDRGHGFFNKGITSDDLDYEDTKHRALEFLQRVLLA